MNPFETSVVTCIVLSFLVVLNLWNLILYYIFGGMEFKIRQF